MSETKTREHPGKMRAFVCEGDGPDTDIAADALPRFTVLAEAKSVSPKDVNEAVKALGPGAYKVLVCRTYPKTYVQVKRDVIS